MRIEHEFKPHTFDWVIDNLRTQDSYIERSMFGCRACYLHGELKLVLADSGEDPWNGVLVATSKEHQAALRREFPEISPHPVLGKWLYLSENQEHFERIALNLERLIIRRDLRIGVIPKQKRRRTSGSRARRITKL